MKIASTIPSIPKKFIHKQLFSLPLLLLMEVIILYNSLLGTNIWDG
jgi:hypothetical protein